MQHDKFVFAADAPCAGAADAAGDLQDVPQALSALQTLLRGDGPPNEEDLAALLRVIEEATNRRLACLEQRVRALNEQLGLRQQERKPNAIQA